MGDYFPPDVRVRLKGDEARARELLGPARRVLFKALQMHLRGRGSHVTVTERLDDGSLITAIIAGPIKQILITVPSTPAPEAQRQQQEAEHAAETANSIFLMCGLVDGGNVVNIDGVNKVRSFRPTRPTALSHHVTDAFHDNARLADGTQWQSVKASHFSGAMKRVAQAVMGLGKITDASGYYLTKPSAPKRVVSFQYDYRWRRTHGVYKAGTRNFWLIEIGKDNGVLAMPLPLVPSTATLSYRRHLQRIGDTGGFAVCDEFGGLPSGETFPTGAALTDAITKGKVLQLMTAAQLQPFYTEGNGYDFTPVSGWAFSESGKQAHNTRVVERRNSTTGKTAITGEHWAIALSLGKHNITQKPVGAGAATLTRLSAGKLSKEALAAFYASSGGERLFQTLYPQYQTRTDLEDLPTWPGDQVHGNPNPAEYEVGAAHNGWGATVYVFFDGEQLRRVKWCPWVLLCNSSRGFLDPVGPPDAVHDPNTIVQEWSDDPELGPWHQLRVQWSVHKSPQAYVCEDLDLRREIIHESTTLGDVKATYARSSDEIPDHFTPGADKSSFGTLPRYPFLSFWFYYNDESDLQEAERAQYDMGDPHYFSGEGDVQDDYWVMIPGFCREACIVGRSAAVLPREMLIVGVAKGVGLFQVSTTNDRFQPADTRNEPHFGAAVNVGPNTAWRMTGGFWGSSVQPRPNPLPTISFGLLEGASPTQSVAGTAFVGAY
jgi:hypothetical protein